MTASPENFSVKRKAASKKSVGMNVWLETADGLMQIVNIPYEVPPREIFRICTRILVLDGVQRNSDMAVMRKRKYVLWTINSDDGRLIYRED